MRAKLRPLDGQGLEGGGDDGEFVAIDAGHVRDHQERNINDRSDHHLFSSVNRAVAAMRGERQPRLMLSECRNGHSSPTIFRLADQLIDFDPDHLRHGQERLLGFGEGGHHAAPFVTSFTTVHADTPPELSNELEELFAEFVATYEDRRREELFAIARAMTSIGMPMADPDEPWVAKYLAKAIEATGGDHDALRAYNLKHWKGQ